MNPSEYASIDGVNSGPFQGSLQEPITVEEKGNNNRNINADKITTRLITEEKKRLECLGQLSIEAKNIEERLKKANNGATELSKKLDQWRKDIITYSNILTNMGDPKEYSKKASAILVNAIKTVRRLNKEQDA